MFAWLRRAGGVRARRTVLVKEDAASLIARFGSRAYYVARDRDRASRGGGVIDANRPRGHWSKVKLRIAVLIGHDVGLDTSTRFLSDAVRQSLDGKGVSPAPPNPQR